MIGSLCSSDFVLTDALRRNGLDADVLRPESEASLGDHSTTLFQHVGPEDVVVFETPERLLRELRPYDVVFSFTAAIGFQLDRLMYAYPALRRLGWPPYINISTGSDITERALEVGRPGILQRFTMRHAFAQGVPPYPDAIRTAVRMRLSNACVLPPVQIAVAIEGAASAASRFRRSDEEILVVHPSNLDWGNADPGPRASTKGNDRFFRAVASLEPEIRRRFRVVALERGPDAGHARALVESLGLSEQIEWAPRLSREELFTLMTEADLVVDQFDVGALGMIAWEAFNVGSPVLAYVDRNSERLAYDVASPVLNAHTSDEIAARLREVADRARLSDLAADATRWAHERRMDDLLPRYLFYASLAVGRALTDFGWDRPHGHQWSVRGT